MLERIELEKLMSFVGKGAQSESTGVPVKGPGVSESVTNLASLLSLPEFREENNPDLPFSVQARYRGNAWGNAIQTVKMENLHYDQESAFLAEWIGRLTRRPGIHCFDRTLVTEFIQPDKGRLQFRITRSEGKNSLLVTCDSPNRKSETIEVWEKGVLIRRTSGSTERQQIPNLVQDGTAVVIRWSSSDTGVEVIIDEGEFGSGEWKALLACLCLQGKFALALELLQNPALEEFAISSILSRFRAFLSGVNAVTKSDGYVLRPLPAVRAVETQIQGIESPGECAPQLFQEAWYSGWNHLARSEFSSATEVFNTIQGCGQKAWELPLENHLASHLESLASAKFSHHEEVSRSAQFWEGVFQDLFPKS